MKDLIMIFGSNYQEYRFCLFSYCHSWAQEQGFWLQVGRSDHPSWAQVEPSWALAGLSWAKLEVFSAQVEPSCAQAGPRWDHVEAKLELC